MRTSRALLVLVLAAASCAHSERAGVTPAGLDEAGAARERAREEARRLSSEYLERFFAFFPEFGTMVGWRGADHAAVHDRSLEARAAFDRDVDRMAEEARRIDATLLSGTPEWVAHGIVLEALESARAVRTCRFELWPVSSVDGWQGEYAALAESQPLDTPALEDAAAQRLSGMGRQIEVEIGVLREGVRQGYTATRENVERVIGELDALLRTPASEWPFVEPARRGGHDRLAVELTRIISNEVAPATRRYREYLAKEYLPNARQRLGVSELPDGEACYRAAVRSSLTMDVPAAEIHDTGLQKLAELRREMQEVGRRSFGTDDVGALLAKLRDAPTFASSAEVIATANAAIARCVAALPAWFGRLPKARVSIQPYPEFQAASHPVERYVPSTNGGALRGIYFVNAFEPTKKPRVELETTTFHEALPGHHLQVALALEATDRPEAARYVWNPGFGEGWALYAERLADEMGVFGSDLDRIGLLASEAFRAARLVVDTGIHTMQWTRDQAVEFLLENTLLTRGVAESEVDRYVVWPGQATSYMLGAMEIRRLREDARAALGPKFDIREFHDLVLQDGGVTLPMLRAKVAAYVAERSRG